MADSRPPMHRVTHEGLRYAVGIAIALVIGLGLWITGVWAP